MTDTTKYTSEQIEQIEQAATDLNTTVADMHALLGVLSCSTYRLIQKRPNIVLTTPRGEVVQHAQDAWVWHDKTYPTLAEILQRIQRLEALDRTIRYVGFGSDNKPTLDLTAGGELQPVLTRPYFGFGGQLAMWVLEQDGAKFWVVATTYTGYRAYDDQEEALKAWDYPAKLCDWRETSSGNYSFGDYLIWCTKQGTWRLKIGNNWVDHDCDTPQQIIG